MTLRVTRVAAQVAGKVTDSQLRVTRVVALVAGKVTTGNLRVTRVAAQVAGTVSTSETIHVSEYRVQVATTDTTEPKIWSSELGTNFSTLGNSSMVLGLPTLAVAGSTKSLTASDTITFQQSASDGGNRNPTYVGVMGSPLGVLGGTDLLPGRDELWDYTDQPGRETSNNAFLSVGINAVDALSTIVALTSIPGTQQSLPGKGFMLGLGAIAFSGNIVNLTATSTVSFTNTTVDVVKEKPRTASSTLVFTQTNARAGSFSATASNAITFVQTNVVAGPKPRTAGSTITFAHTAAKNLHVLTAHNNLIFSQKADAGGIKEVTAGNSIAFTQGANPGLHSRTAHNNVTFSQLANQGVTLANAIALTATSAVTFTQTNNRFIVFADAIVLTASDVLTFTQHAIFPIVLTASNTVSFNNSASGNAGKSGTSVIEFTQTVVANHWRSVTASNTLNLSHGFIFEHIRDGIPINPGAGTCDVTKTYAPLTGGAGNLHPIRPVAPALNRKTDVIFYTPAPGPVCSATDSLTLRTPNFGDRDRNQYNRVNRESRGGSLTIFRDPKWPKQRTLVMDFSGIKDSEVDTTIQFLENTLGQEIGFRDWNSRVWTGIIINPDSSVTRTGRDRNDISIEMEVTDTAFNLNACSVVDFTQSAAVELIPV
jgi:hypothetical protein